MKRRYIYAILGLVFAASVALAAVPTLGDATRAVTALPAAAAVIGATFQLLRDQLAHERATALQATQNSLAVGATSHMAIVAFDKHVSFSEEYVGETFKTLKTLFREGPTELALTHAAQLYQIRENWAVWLTPAIDSRLEKFESALRRIGADTHWINVDLAHPDRSQTIRKTMELFRDVMGRHISESPGNAEHTIAAVVEELRSVLGISALTELRQMLVCRSLDSEPANNALHRTPAGGIESRRG
jgi:hypothetical protein